MNASLRKIISILFHPALLPVLNIVLLWQFCPQIFQYDEQQKIVSWLVQIALNTFLFPLLTVLLLWKLEFAKSIYLKTQRERYAPYIASILFYFWIFYVFYKTQRAPDVVVSFLLGNFLALCFLFFINIFNKISMHATGVGATLAIQSIGYLAFKGHLWGVLIAIAMCVLVIPSRLGKEEHNKAQLVAGFILGIVTQLFAYWFIKKSQFS